MRKQLEAEYESLLNKYGVSLEKHEKINMIVKESISAFTAKYKNPAIWCYGKHTKMLMADFIFEMKNVHYIIDKKIDRIQSNSGFEIISKNQIYEKQIDAIIISSKMYQQEIINELKKNYSDIPYLDIYAELEKEGIYLYTSYFNAGNNPYSVYQEINRLRNMVEAEDISQKGKCIRDIIDLFIKIKDFKSALQYVKELKQYVDEAYVFSLEEDLDNIYRLQMSSWSKVRDNNVVMFCLDGLRQQEIEKGYMQNLSKYIDENLYYFTNAYSVSTSTYESLIPTYSENDDLRTKYYESNIVKNEDCRFINVAKEQKRKIYFYTDGCKYVDADDIQVTDKHQTATEKMWDFLLDALAEENGLFYVHILYESHYSYPNPYTKKKLIAEGTNIMFDYLEHNGGEIRTDYAMQQKDALRYLDDVIVPMLERLDCGVVLYADHGNILLDQEVLLKDVEYSKFTFHEDLIRVPLGIKIPKMGKCKDDKIRSIMDLNTIIIGLMKRQKPNLKNNEYIKVLRSEIYNPDFKFLYKEVGKERGLMAFEAFIFERGYKLAIYADGCMELYQKESDTRIENITLQNQLYEIVKDKITVC